MSRRDVAGLNWRQCTVADVVYVDPAVPASPHWDPDQRFPHVSMGGIDEINGVVAQFDSKPWREVKSGKARFEEGDVLFARITPCTENGKVALVRGLTAAVGFGSSELYVLRAGHLVVPEYLWFFVRSHLVRERAAAAMTGTSGRQRVPATFWEGLQMPVPPILVQRRIVEILTKADEIRRKRVEASAIADAVLLSTFLHYFGDPLVNPHGYPLVPLGELGEVVSGVTKGRPLDPAKAVEVPYLRVANVQDGFLDLSEVKTILALPSEVEKFRLEEGDILMTEGGDPDKLGRGCIWRRQVPNCIHQNHIFRVRLDPGKALPEFIATLMLTAYAKHYFLRGAKRTSNLASINSTQVKAFQVPLPPIEKQRCFVEAEEQRLAIFGKIEKMASHQRALLASLDAHAFAGDLTADWERENAEEIATYQRVHEELPRLVLVGLIEAAEREAAKRAVLLTALMKYAFLFQMRNRARQRLYAFRPYKYGPFASEIYDHLDVLESEGLLRQRESGGTGEREWRAIELTPKGRAYAKELLPVFDPELAEELAGVAREYGPLDHEALLDRVYAEYPEFARRSVRGRPAESTRKPRQSRRH